MKKVSFIIFALFMSLNTLAQQDWKTLGADDLFSLARQKAFDGQREQAREMLRHILATSPDYHDVRILLGRTFAWDGQRDLARQEFQTVLSRAPENLDAFNAYTDVEMWDDNYDQALVIADSGLKIHPNDEDLLYKRASILNSLKRQEDAVIGLNKLLLINPAHQKGLALLKSIRISSMKYTASASYGVDLFSRSFDAAHNASVQLGRTNSWGSAIVRVNYAHRFNTDGVQPEVDLYPRIASGVYAYLNYGFSSTDLFPRHRIGAELFTKLPASFEASAGTRYLYFDTDTKVTIFTGSVGWYVKDYWLSLRPYITPDEETGTSVSASLTVRRYFEDAETYLALSAGLGFSPDLRRLQSGSGLSEDEIYLLHAQRAGITFQKALRDDLALNVSADFSRQELIFDEGNYVVITSAGVGLRKKF